MTEKIAVVLMNLGGPSDEKSIRPFLFNFFMDKNIIAAPLPIRFLIAKWIAFTRGKGAAKDSYAPLGFKSPLLENTQAQAAALEQKLRADGIAAKVFVSMRYWHPRANDVQAEIARYRADKVILLPLYPQFSTTTSFSSLQEWAQKDKSGIKTEKICCYPFAEGFIKASAALIRQELEKAPDGTRVLFSAHGLPEKVIAGGDPYQFQCEQSAAKIAAAANLPDWQICYQSRVGPLKWIGPSTEEALEKAATDKKGIIIYPHAFVSEHVETLVEIEMEYRERAHELGISYFARVNTVGTHPLFIETLAALVKKKIAGEKTTRICPVVYNRCGCAL